MQNTVENNYICDICKRGTTKIIYEVGCNLVLCPSCSSQLYTCRGCAHRAECNLELNPQNIQPYINKIITQNGMVITQQIPNPELKQIYCKECRCIDKISGECMREYCQFCTKWELHSEYKKEE